VPDSGVDHVATSIIQEAIIAAIEIVLPGDAHAWKNIAHLIERQTEGARKVKKWETQSHE
jgi:hypothetical protein